MSQQQNKIETMIIVGGSALGMFIKVPNDQVSDTRDDAIKNKCRLPKKLQFNKALMKTYLNKSKQGMS